MPPIFLNVELLQKLNLPCNLNNLVSILDTSDHFTNQIDSTIL